MKQIKIISNKIEWGYFISFIILIFSLNLFWEYSLYKDLKKNQLIELKATTKNIYEKADIDVVLLKTKKFEFYTSINKEFNLQKHESLYITILTSNISFLEYLKGFYTPSINPRKIDSTKTLKEIMILKVNSLHDNILISEFYNAIYFGDKISSELREKINLFGVSHLVALSGFHLGVIVFVVYWIFYLFYFWIHKTYFPYRNIKFDLMIISIVFLISYMLIIGLIASLFRAFVMFIIGVYFLRSNIKMISFETLLITVFLVLALFPSFIFSLSFWFSIAGVFYIFLFVKYYVNLNKFLLLILFNLWIFMSMNIFSHYFFPLTSMHQIFSPFITILFSIFYPLSLFFHLLGVGDIFDSNIIYFLGMKIESYEYNIDDSFFLFYLLLSFLSIFKRYFFIILNIFVVVITLDIFF